MSNTVGRGRGPMGRRRGMSGEKAKDFKDAMLRLLKYMERYKFRLILMVILQSAEPYLILLDQRF